MKTDELRKKEIDELKKMLAEERKGLSNLRFRAAGSDLENSSQFAKSRKQVARILTVLGERARQKSQVS